MIPGIFRDRVHIPLCCAILALATTASAVTYDVGTDQPLKTIAGVPWAALAPGDNVNIHWQPAPYKEKWVICRRDISVCGIPGPHGELPVIDGADATTPKPLDFPGEMRAVIKVGTSRVPKDTTPANILIEGLDVQNAYPTNSFLGAKGPAKYAKDAASIWIEKGEGIVIRDCAIHGSGNGIFVSHSSHHVLIDRCHIYGNGVEKEMFEHNVYTEADGIVFQNNHFGPLRPGSGGSNLKDRSAGLVVRDNWIEGGARELDLVDAEGSEALRKEPSYQQTYVYRNIIVKLPTDGNKQVVHYGGDSGKPAWYRKGTLFFYNNTVISKRSDGTTLFRLMANDEHVDARNNIFYTIGPGKSLAMVDSVGCVDLTSNWINHGWVNCHGSFSGSINAGKGNIEGASPGFVNEAANDHRLAPNSPCRNAGVGITLPGEPQSANPPDIGAPVK